MFLGFNYIYIYIYIIKKYYFLEANLNLLRDNIYKMIIYDYEDKYIIFNSKAGATSVKSGGKHFFQCSCALNFHKHNKKYENLKQNISKEDIYKFKKLKNKKIVLILRNPLDRYLSGYNYWFKTHRSFFGTNNTLIKNPTIQTFLNLLEELNIQETVFDSHFLPQICIHTKYILDNLNIEIVKLEDSQKLLGIKKLNTNNGKKIKYLTKEQEEKIKKIYKNDWYYYNNSNFLTDEDNYITTSLTTHVDYANDDGLIFGHCIIDQDISVLPILEDDTNNEGFISLLMVFGVFLVCCIVLMFFWSEYRAKTKQIYYVRS